jgi:ubiquinone biosynthesis protein
VKPFDLFSNAVRAKEVAAILVRNGFADLLQKLKLPLWLRKIVDVTPRERKNIWERIRIVAEELGPASIKLGQLLSMRPDIVPEELLFELRKLQDQVKPIPFEEMEKVLCEELGCSLEEAFTDFDKDSVASASMAQVYFARLRETGEEVAIKVQRPGLRRIVDADLGILLWFARQAHEALEDIRPYNLPGVLEELKQVMERELDYRNEARNVLFFNLQNGEDECVFAPKVFDEWTSDRLLVMEKITGLRLQDIEPSSKLAEEIAHNGARSICHQILVHGFFHADPHGGNMIVTEDGRLCLLDWGMVGQLTRRMRFDLMELLGAFMSGEAEQIVRVAANMPRSESKFDRTSIEKEVMMVQRENFNPQTGEGEIGRAILKMLYVFGCNGVEVARDFALMAKSILSIEEAGKALMPKFNFKEAFEPVLLKLQKERRNPLTFLKMARQSVAGSLHRLQDIPGEVYRVLRRLEEDNVTVNFQHRGLEQLNGAMNSASNKITLGVILGSLLIGSSLIITTGAKPLLFGYPALGIVGYLLSAVLGLWVIIDILRGGKHR